MLAIITPIPITNADFLLFRFNILEAKIAEYAPLKGNGIAVNIRRANSSHTSNSFL